MRTSRCTPSRIAGPILALVFALTACNGTLDLAVETAPAPTPTVLSSPTPAPTQAPAGAFPYTDAWFAAHGNEYPTDEQMEQLADAFAADVMAYLGNAITPTLPLEDQASALAHMAADLPGFEGGQVVPVNLDDVAGAELFVVPNLNGGPLLYARYAPTGWQVIPVPVAPPGEEETVANALNLWPHSAEVRDVTSDGHPEAVTIHIFSGGSNWREHPQVLRWDGERFTVLFRAELVNWAGASQWHFEPHGAGQDIVITYPIFMPSRPDKFDPHPEGVQRWRWDAEADRYVLWSTAVQTPAPIVERLAKSEIALQAGEYSAALCGYSTFLADEAWQDEFLVQHQGAMPGVGERELAAWLDFARLHAALCHALLDEPDETRQTLNAIETDDLLQLAHAFSDAYGDDTNLVAALAAYERVIAAQPAREGIAGEPRPAGVAWAYRPWPYTVLALLNAANGPALLDRAINEYGLPVQTLWTDLDGDGRDELAWLSDAEWRVVWVGWQEENGTWRATGVAAGDDLALEDIAPPDEIQRRGIVVHYYGAERILRWDGKLKMIHVPPDERPVNWPIVGDGQ